MFNQKETYFEIVSDEYRIHKDTDIILPTRAHSDDAGYDLYTPVDIEIPGLNFDDDVVFKSTMVWLDIKVHLPVNNVLILDIRSGLGTKSELQIANTIPIIDSRHYYNKDNGGNIGIQLRNLSRKSITITKGYRVAQGVILPYGIVTGDYYGRSENPKSAGFGGTDSKDQLVLKWLNL